MSSTFNLNNEIHVSKYQKRPRTNVVGSSLYPVTSNKKQSSLIKCPWWNGNIGPFYHKCNVYGLYHYVLSHHDNNCVDLSFWPINDHDIRQLITQLVKMRYITNNKDFEELQANGILNVQTLKLHSCTYVTDVGIRYLALNWKRIGTGDELEEHRPMILDCTRNPSNIISFHLLHLDLSNCRNITNMACQDIGTQFDKLKSLDLSDCVNITDVGLKYIMTGCKRLQEIHLKNLVKLQDEGLAYMRQTLVVMKSLRIIDIAGCTGFTNEAIIHLLECDTTPGVIHQLDLSGCTQLHLGVIGLSRNIVSNNVKVIKMCNLNVSDSMLGWIASGCKNLQKIDLSGCSFVHTSSLGYLFNGCKRLKSLCLNECHQVTEEALVGIDVETGEHLLELELMDCSKLNSLTRIVQLCPRLLKLNLRGLSKLSDESIYALAISCPLLEFLDLSTQIVRTTHDSKSYIPRVGPEGIKALGNHCHKLRVLRCNGCSHLNDDCIHAVARGCVLIEELGLKGCYRLTNEAVIAIGQYCSSLVRIYLSSCKHISDYGIKRLCHGCQKLEVLELEGLTNLSDDGVVQMAINCRNLKRVNLQECYKLSDKSLRALFGLCIHIEDVNVCAVDNLTDNAIQKDIDSSFIRTLNLGGSNVSDVMLKNVSRSLLFSKKLPNKLSLVPLHRQREIHNQHIKYISFLYKYQVFLFCYLKSFSLKRRLLVRYSRHSQCHKIQTSYRNHRNVKALQEFAMVLKQEKQSKLFTEASATTIKAFFQMVYYRNRFSLLRSACRILQQTIKAYLINKRRNNIFDGCCNVLIPKLVDVITSHSIKSQVESREFKQHQSVIQVDTSAILYWKKLVSKMVYFAQKNLINSSALTIQNIWRYKKNKDKVKEKRFRLQKYKAWLISFAHEQRARIQKQVLASIVIEQFLQSRYYFDLKIRMILQEIKLRNDTLAAYKKICMFLRSHLKIKEAKNIVATMHCNRLQQIKQISATVKLQCWWRVWSSLAKLHHKQGIIRRWKVMVTGKYSLVKYRAAAIIQKRIRHRLRIKASLFLVSRLSMLLKLKGHRKKLHLKKEANAAALIVSIFRRFTARTLFLKKKVASICICKIWKAYSCRQFYRKLCVEEKKRLRQLEITKKENMLEDKRLKRIELIIYRTEDKAARTIQSCYLNFVDIIHRERVAMERDEVKLQKLKDEIDRRLAFKVFRKQKRNATQVVKRYMIEAISKLSNITPYYNIIEGVNISRNNQKKDKVETKRLYEEIIKYSILKANGETKKSPVVKSFHDSIESSYGCYDWFDKQCKDLILSYVLLPNEVHSLRRIWKTCLDFRNEEAISIHDFFDHVQEKASEYGKYLFTNINVSPEEPIRFSEYIRMIIYVSLLGKNEIFKLVFRMKCKIGATYLEKDGWASLVMAMLTSEDIQYPSKRAVEAFGTFASSDLHGTKLLFFNDFRDVSTQIITCLEWAISYIKSF